MHRMAHPLLVATVLASLANPAHAQESTGTRLYNEGWRLYKEKQYAEACPLLERSLAASPKIRTRGALALCYEAAGKVASAYNTWRAVAEQAAGAGAVEAASLKRAVEKTEQLAPKVTRIVFQPVESPAGLQVSLDGRVLAGSELGVPLPVDPGDHSLEARAPERVEWKSTFTIAASDAGQTRSLPIGPLPPMERVRVETPPGPTGPSEPSRPPIAPPVDRGPPTHPLKYAAVATAGAGVVAIAVGTLFALSAKSKWDDAKALGCDDNGTCRTQEGVDLVDSAGSKATVGTISFIAGVALIGGGAAMWFLAPKPEPKVMPSVSVGPGGAHVGLVGTF